MEPPQLLSVGWCFLLVFLFCCDSGGGCRRVQVVMEEGSAVYGAVQHSLLMAVIRENIFEAPLVAPVPPPFYGAPGIPYPEPAPLPERLGPDPATWPKWEVEVRRLASA